jgi:protein-tyrosine phosphatase
MKATIYPVESALPNRLAIIARPRGGDWLCDEIAAFAGEGVEVVVSMLTSEEMEELGLNDEREKCEAAAITFVNIPIPDRAVPSERDSFLDDVDRVADLVRQGHSVGVHCRASIGRSSMFAAALLVRLGWTADRAFTAIESARGCPVPDTPEQRRWVVENLR